MAKLIIIVVLMVLAAYALAAVTPYVVPFLRYLAARYGFAARRPGDVAEAERPAPEDKEILRFFEVPPAGMSRWRARHEVEQLLADPRNLEAWNERPADVLQGEFFRCFGLRMPPGLTALEAAELIRDHRARIEEEDASLLDDWDAFESICVELLDPDAGAAYDIRTPELTAIRSAVDALRKEGHSLSTLADHRRLVVDKLVQSDPELRLPRD